MRNGKPANRGIGAKGRWAVHGPSPVDAEIWRAEKWGRPGGATAQPRNQAPADEFKADEFRADEFKADEFRADEFRADPWGGAWVWV